MTMRYLFKMLFGGIALFAFAHCGSSQTLQSQAPFTLEGSAIEPWTAGDSDQFRGVNLLFPVTSGKEIVLDTVYYGRKKSALIRIQKDDYLVYKATVDTTNTPYDVVMHADPKEEFGNRPPVREDVPFELMDDEAVISYLEKGRRKYVKISGLKISTPIHYRERPNVKNRR